MPVAQKTVRDKPKRNNVTKENSVKPVNKIAIEDVMGMQQNGPVTISQRSMPGEELTGYVILDLPTANQMETMVNSLANLEKL